MKILDFTLSEPVKCHKQGSEVESSLLELTAPSTKGRKRVAKLKQDFMRSINSLNSDSNVQPDKKDDGKKDDGKITPEQAMALIQMGSCDYGEYMDTFINHLTSGVCKIEGEVELTQTIADSISFEDMERLMGEYLVNFILTSSEE